VVVLESEDDRYTFTNAGTFFNMTIPENDFGLLKDGYRVVFIEQPSMERFVSMYEPGYIVSDQVFLITSNNVATKKEGDNLICFVRGVGLLSGYMGQVGGGTTIQELLDTVNGINKDLYNRLIGAGVVSIFILEMANNTHKKSIVYSTHLKEKSAQLTLDLA
jgi:hypothetical protein